MDGMAVLGFIIMTLPMVAVAWLVGRLSDGFCNELQTEFGRNYYIVTAHNTRGPVLTWFFLVWLLTLLLLVQLFPVNLFIGLPLAYSVSKIARAVAFYKQRNFARADNARKALEAGERD